jgi:PKD repeat protein
MRASRPQIRYPSRPFGPPRLRPRAPSGSVAVSIASVLALALLAGCTAGGGDGNASPHASLEVNKDNGYTGEDFTFDAQDSTDPDGEVTAYRFDFGDGSPPMEVSDEDAARVTHAYAKGGEYTVTLTVTDDGKDNTGSLSDNEAVNIVVNERVRVASTAISTVPGSNETAETELPFAVYDRANRFDLNITLLSALVTGSSEFKVSVVDPDGDTIAEKTQAVGPGAQGQVLTLDGLLTKQGEHLLVLEAVSGGGTAEGELRIIYGEDLG